MVRGARIKVEMRSGWRVLGIALLLAGCSDGGPPLDELSLREALGAKAEVVAGLPVAARRRLAERFEAARVQPESAQALPSENSGSGAGAGERSPREILRAVDAARAAAGRDALIAAELEGGLVAPLAARDDDDEALPPVEYEDAGAASSAIAGVEAAALSGRAGAVVRALVRQSGAHRIARVDGWPAAALAAGDVVYVDGAWLVALAALDDAPDAGVSSTANPTPNAHATANTHASATANAHATTNTHASATSNARTVRSAQKLPNAPNVHSVQPPPPARPAPSLRAWPVAYEALPDAGPATLHPEDDPLTATDLATTHVVPVAHGTCDQSCGDTACNSAQGASACGDGCDDNQSDDNSCDDCSGGSDGTDCSGGDCSGGDCSGCGDFAKAARTSVRSSPRSTRLGWLLLPLVYLQRARRRRK